MEDLTALINSRQPQIKELLRQYGSNTQPSEAAVYNAYQQHGNAFLLKLIDILNNPQMKTPFITNRFDNYIDENGVEQPGPEMPAATATTGNGFTWLENILKGAGMIANSYGTIKNTITGTVTPDQAATIAAQEETKAKQSKNLMYVAGFILVLVVVVLIVKTRK